jgi:hypothetical protein
MCWGFEFSVNRPDGTFTSIDVNGIDKLVEFYKMYGKDVPEGIIDPEYFDSGKRKTIAEMGNSCLCPADKDTILRFAARAVLKETRGIDPTKREPLCRGRHAISDISSKIDDAIDHLRDVTFRGNGNEVVVSWF